MFGGGGERVKEGEGPIQPGPEGITDERLIVFTARSPWEHTYLCSRQTVQACLWDTAPTPLSSLSEFELILTIVGTIAGILILGMLIALIFTRYGKQMSLYWGTVPLA